MHYLLRTGVNIFGVAGLMMLLLSSCGSEGGGGTAPVVAGSISGTAVAGGSGVAGAQIALSSGGSQTTGTSGQFTFSNVPAGSHTLTIAPPTGFQLEAGEAASKPVNLTVGQSATVNFSLRASTGNPAQSAEISLAPSSFTPADVTVARGGTVRWVNGASIAHTITPANSSQDGVWQSQNIPAQQGFSFSHTFTTAGVYNYSCILHAGMVGVIRVP
ncbi:hypothetical protein BH23GEM6_BH23GEM6_11710 [soil metagenome]